VKLAVSVLKVKHILRFAEAEVFNGVPIGYLATRNTK